MVKQIVNKQLEKALKRVGIENIGLFKDGTEGYFYVDGLTDETKDILNLAYSTSIYVYSFNQMSIKSWVDEISRIWDDALKNYTNSMDYKKGHKDNIIHIGNGMTIIDYNEN